MSKYITSDKDKSFKVWNTDIKTIRWTTFWSGVMRRKNCKLHILDRMLLLRKVSGLTGFSSPWDFSRAYCPWEIPRNKAARPRKTSSIPPLFLRICQSLSPYIHQRVIAPVWGVLERTHRLPYLLPWERRPAGHWVQIFCRSLGLASQDHWPVQSSLYSTWYSACYSHWGVTGCPTSLSAYNRCFIQVFLTKNTSTCMQASTCWGASLRPTIPTKVLLAKTGNFVTFTETSTSSNIYIDVVAPAFWLVTPPKLILCIFLIFSSKSCLKFTF